MCEMPISCRPSCAFLSPSMAYVEDLCVLVKFFQPLHAVIWSGTSSFCSNKAFQHVSLTYNSSIMPRARVMQHQFD